MRKHGITILLVLICLLGLRPLIMAETSLAPSWKIIFTEVLLGTTESGSAEYIELYNTTDETINLTNWKIEYLASTATSWDKPTRTISLSGSINPSSYSLVASTAYDSLVTATRYSSTLSQTGGHIRLISSIEGTQAVQDLLAWGSAKLGLGDAVVAPLVGLSMNRLKNPEELYEPKTNNIDDFILTSSLTPLDDYFLPIPEPIVEPPLEVTSPTDTIDTTETENAITPELNQNSESTPPIVYYPIEISELFPNPAEPLSDANDEFVELYNPYNFRIELKGYQLLGGINGSYKHTFKDGDVIEPGQYLVITSKDSSLTLSNTAGKVVLVAPDGNELSQTQQYSSAPEGQSWIFYEGSWQWTTSVTIGTVNQLKLATIAIKADSKKTASIKAKSTKVKTAAAKPKVKANGVSTKKDADQKSSYIEEVSGPVNPLVLAGTATLVVLYACYEYRKDFSNKIHQLRSNRENRRANRTGSPSSASH